MVYEILIRSATLSDLPQLETLLRQSYGELLKPDYSPELLCSCLPFITRARLDLLQSGCYYMAFDDRKQAVAAGGWTHTPPQGGVGPRDVGHIRHVATAPNVTRQGHAKAILQRSFKAARNSGIRWLMCQSTLTAEPFYRSLGFQRRGEIEITLAPGLYFPAVEMMRRL